MDLSNIVGEVKDRHIFRSSFPRWSLVSVFDSRHGSMDGWQYIKGRDFSNDDGFLVSLNDDDKRSGPCRGDDANSGK